MYNNNNTNANVEIKQETKTETKKVVSKDSGMMTMRGGLRVTHQEYLEWDWD